jgi:hypothetical protein
VYLEALPLLWPNAEILNRSGSGNGKSAVVRAKTVEFTTHTRHVAEYFSPAFSPLTVGLMFSTQREEI